MATLVISNIIRNSPSPTVILWEIVEKTKVVEHFPHPYLCFLKPRVLLFQEVESIFDFIFIGWIGCHKRFELAIEGLHFGSMFQHLLGQLFGKLHAIELN